MGVWGRLVESLRPAPARGGDVSNAKSTAPRDATGERGTRRSARGGARAEERRFGTGLWRQHHDRFLRAVDRFYTTAVDLRAEAEQASPTPAATSPDAASSASTAPAESPRATAPADAAEVVARQTLVLNDLADRFDRLTETCHARYPLDDLVVPAEVRTEVGMLPTLMSKAAAKTAEACQAAAMARVAVRTGTDPGQAARAAERYVGDSSALVARCEEALRND